MSSTKSYQYVVWRRDALQRIQYLRVASGEHWYEDDIKLATRFGPIYSRTMARSLAKEARGMGTSTTYGIEEVFV
jgi:hypothetical protein